MRAVVRRPPALVLLLAVLVLVATVAARPPHAPPLYDGLGFPDEPYRWIVPPPGAAPTPQAATPALATITVTGGVSGRGQGVSAEQGPQVAVAVAPGAFAVPAGASAVTLQAVPEPVPATQPDHGQVVSNLYTVSATAEGSPVRLAAGRDVLLNLRADKATDQAVVICRWTGRGWEQLVTKQVGTDIYAADLDVMAPVAVVRLDRGTRPTVSAARPVTAASDPARAGSGGPGAGTLWLALGLVVVALAAGLLVVRRRTGGEPPD